MTDLADFLRARYEETRQCEQAKRMVIPSIFDDHEVERRYNLGEPETLYVNGNPYPVEEYTEIATRPAPDPDVLADLGAKLAIIDDLLAEGHDVVEDCWYTCAAATEERDGGETCDEDRQGGPCDCGRDARVNRRLRILARPFAGHTDYQEDWAA